MADAPKRIQLSRRKGWRMPPNTVSVARPARWGNPFRVQIVGRERAVSVFREYVEGFFNPGNFRDLSDADFHAVHAEAGAWRRRLGGHPTELLHELRGKNLACWCRLCEQHRDGKPFDVECEDCAPCHTDVLGPLANSEITNEGPGAANNRSGDIQR